MEGRKSPHEPDRPETPGETMDKGEESPPLKQEDVEEPYQPPLGPEGMRPAGMEIEMSYQMGVGEVWLGAPVSVYAAI